MNKCGCGIPNRANIHYDVGIGRDLPGGGSETSDVDIYVCTAHDHDNPMFLLHPDIARDWDVIDYTRTEIR